MYFLLTVSNCVKNSNLTKLICNERTNALHGEKFTVYGEDTIP